ncbi:MAG: LysR family transcriptional regulator [Amaricoccus sp.]|uniref:LysR family transcriptional regulator n=1 Tax=Amaricoccus sp. TaxID=1872485 RepID=UPI00331576FD
MSFIMTLDATEFPKPARGAERLIGRGLKLTHLRLIAALAETTQLTATARALSISQPAASRLLAEAEGIVGHALCERRAKGIALTAAGRALAARAQAVLLEIAEAGREVGDVAAGRLGTVSLGAVTAAAVDLVVPTLQRLQRQNPGLQASVDVATSDVLIEDLRRGRHDFIVGRVPISMDPAPFEIRPLRPEVVALIVRSNHPLAQRASVGARDLAPYDWVMQQPGSLLRATLEEALLERGSPPPNCRLSTSSLLLTLALVTRSNAIAPVSAEVARLVCGQGGLGRAIATLPIDFYVEIKPFCLIRLRGHRPSPSAALVQDALLEDFRG